MARRGRADIGGSLRQECREGAGGSVARHAGVDLARPGVDAAREVEHVAETLRQLGFEVETAEDAVAARQIVDAGRPVDLLVSDIGLPGGTDGWAVADYMRQARPGVRIVLMTGYAQTIDKNSPPVRLFTPSGTAGAYFSQFGWTGADAPGLREPCLQLPVLAHAGHAHRTGRRRARRRAGDANQTLPRRC